MNTRVITVFGSSRPREEDPDYQEAFQLGCALGTAGFDVCTGGYGGVMEAVSRGAKTVGAMTYGVTTGFFKLCANAWVDKEIRVDSWQARLFELIRIGDGFVACKGGTGTLAEIAVVWEMLNKAVMAGKPFVVLGDFWVPIGQRFGRAFKARYVAARSVTRGSTSLLNSVRLATVSSWSNNPPCPIINRCPKPPTWS